MTTPFNDWLESVPPAVQTDRERFGEIRRDEEGFDMPDNPEAIPSLANQNCLDHALLESRTAQAVYNRVYPYIKGYTYQQVKFLSLLFSETFRAHAPTAEHHADLEDIKEILTAREEHIRLLSECFNALDNRLFWIERAAFTVLAGMLLLLVKFFIVG